VHETWFSRDLKGSGNVQEKYLATIPYNIYIVPCNLSLFKVKQLKQDIKWRCNPHFLIKCMKIDVLYLK